MLPWRLPKHRIARFFSRSTYPYLLPHRNQPSGTESGRCLGSRQTRLRITATPLDLGWTPHPALPTLHLLPEIAAQSLPSCKDAPDWVPFRLHIPSPLADNSSSPLLPYWTQPTRLWTRYPSCERKWSSAYVFHQAPAQLYVFPCSLRSAT